MRVVTSTRSLPSLDGAPTPRRRASTPVAELGLAALDDPLEPGDLDDWQPLLAEVRRDPDGAVAERVLQLVERQLLSGTSELWRSWIESQRSVERAPHTGASLKTLRQSQGLTQQQVAERLGMTHPRWHGSKGCRDAKLSRIRAYVRARGGELQTSARFGDEVIPLD